MRNLDSIFDGAARSLPNPFRDDVFAPGISALPGITDIHGEALNRCLKAFETLLADRGTAQTSWGGSGRTLLIAAPRAGFGKSHLVGRVRAVTESLIAPVALPFDPARPVGWDTMLVSVFNQYRSSRCPQHRSGSLFEETARFFQSLTVRYAIERGVVDQKEIPENESAIRLQFREVFDPKSGNRLVPWLTKRSPEIMDGVAGPLCARWGLEFDDLVFWNRFFQDATKPKTTAFEQFRSISVAGARDRLGQFLRVASDCRPIAFIADNLDGFFGSDTAGMRIAEILTELRFLVPRSVTLLCLNQDVWASVFEGKIPTAWIDRLTGEATALRGVSADDGVALLRARLLATGWNAAETEIWLRHHHESCLRSDFAGGALFPREILRNAARAWERQPLESKATDGFTAPTPPPARPASAATSAVPHPLDSVTSFFTHRSADDQSSSNQAKNVFSATEAAAAGAHFVPTDPSRQSPPSAPSRPAARVDDPSAAARAAGIDPSHGLPNIDAIIAEIRGAGARSFSEGPGSGSASPAVSRTPAPAAPPSAADIAQRQLEIRLHQLENEAANNGGRALDWQPRRVERLIRAVGEHFPAVGQTVEPIQGQACLLWSVRGAAVRIGFEAPEHFSFWSQVLDRAITTGTGAPSKVVLFSHPSAPFDQQALAAMGAGIGAAPSRHVDTIELNDSNLALLYGAERFLSEAYQGGFSERAIRIVAKRLDPFWRRLARPMSNAGAA
jgi:hypothetical protein